MPDKKINNKVYDVASYNMLMPYDGAHVIVPFDSLIHVTLKHPSSQYILLYTVGDQWKVVDWNKKKIDQY